MMKQSTALDWFSVQLAIAVGGTAAAIINPLIGLFVFALSLPVNFFALQMGFKTRENSEQNKPIADGIAVAGMTVFALLFFQVNLTVALGGLLYFGTLALCVQMDVYRKFYMAQVISFVFILGGAAEAKSGGYLFIMAAYCLVAAFSLTEIWLDKSRGAFIDSDSSEGNRGSVFNDSEFSPGLKRRSAVGALVMGVAVFIYLFLPRPEALNYGSQASSAPDFYSDQSWENDAQENPASARENKNRNTSKIPKNDREAYKELKEITDLSGYGETTQDTYRYNGLNETFDIRDNSRSGTIDLNTIIARMKAAHGAYLKIRTFDTFDGLSWSSSNENISRKLQTSTTGEVTLSDAIKGDFQHSLMIEHTIPAWLPVAGEPVTLWLPASVIALDQFNHPLLPRVLQAGTEYTVLSRLELIDGRVVSLGTPATKQDQALPSSFSAKIRQLAKEVTASATDPYSKAVLLEQHLRTNYTYSFESITASQGRTPLKKFLFEDKSGHCEYFASAMAIMLRSLNIPSRLVTGFSATTQNPLTGYYEIRGIDGHAWVEAWIDGRWVSFEPTAYYSLPSAESSSITAEKISQYASDILHRQQSGVQKSITIESVLSTVWLGLYVAVVWVLSYMKLIIVTLWPLWILLSLVAIAALVTRPLWRSELRARMSHRKIGQYAPQEAKKALTFYIYHLQRVAQRHDVVRNKTETVGDWSEFIEQKIGRIQAMDELAGYVQRVFYDAQPVAIPEIQATALAISDYLISSKRNLSVSDLYRSN
ncbi:MAG: transglutaminaseTgpA domain-containing protein [Thalassolituus sp.]|jgi:transglutaminase-like putative cysteine protease